MFAIYLIQCLLEVNGLLKMVKHVANHWRPEYYQNATEGSSPYIHNRMFRSLNHLSISGITPTGAEVVQYKHIN